jgi:hypothetical protein
MPAARNTINSSSFSTPSASTVTTRKPGALGGRQRFLDAGHGLVNGVRHEIDRQAQIPPFEQRAGGFDRHDACRLIESVPGLVGDLI